MSLIPETGAATTGALAGRTQSIAHRLLSGAGCASLLAHRLDPQVFWNLMNHI